MTPAADPPWLLQDRWDVRFEWGPSGTAGARSGAVVVVDVMRFTTAVDAAVGRGVAVHPYRWKDEGGRALAERVGAVFADPGGGDSASLSPVGLLALEPGDRVVLPSPNGSTCADIAARTGAQVVAACMRNASAVARWLDASEGSVTVIACGERWPDGSLRPALEDHLGAGAVIAAMGGTRSPEAQAAADLWESTVDHVGTAVASCISGREAVTRGWQRDLDFATQVDVSAAVPVLREGAFVDATTAAPPGEG
jgi:2-phosphosulfolactate phosphatase